MNSSHRLVGLLLVLLGLVGSSPAWADKSAVLELGVYTPRLYFKDNLQRTRFARDVAASLSQATKMEIRGRAFTQLRDLRAFMNAKRLDLGLLDAGILSSLGGRVNVVGTAASSNGVKPPFAVLARDSHAGIRSLKGRRLALVKAGPRELSLISNFALEGEVAAEKYFGDIRWASDMAEVVRWLKSGTVDCTLAYADMAKRTGLSVVVPLQGMPMPRLVVVRGSSAESYREQLVRGLDNGLVIGGNWPILRLQKTQSGAIASLQNAEAQPSGRRTVRRAVWSAAPTESLNFNRYRFKTENDHRINPITDRWREPEFSEL